MIPAPHAIFRARPAEIVSPVSSLAAVSPPSSDSSVMVTTTVAERPPVLGSP